MRQLSKIESIIMLIGGGIMVICAGLVMASTLMAGAAWVQKVVLIVPWLFLLGAIAYVGMQRRQDYTGKSHTIRRLRSIQLLSGLCFIIAGLFMVENFYHFVESMVVKDINSYMTYMQVVHNNWVVLMLIGAVLQMYTAHRISYELNKES